MTAQSGCGGGSTCDVASGLRFSKICHCAVLNKIVEATIPMNPYNDRTVWLRWPLGKGDLDIIRASLTHRKANITEALVIFLCVQN